MDLRQAESRPIPSTGQDASARRPRSTARSRGFEPFDLRACCRVPLPASEPSQRRCRSPCGGARCGTVRFSSGPTCASTASAPSVQGSEGRAGSKVGPLRIGRAQFVQTFGRKSASSAGCACSPGAKHAARLRVPADVAVAHRAVVCAPACHDAVDVSERARPGQRARTIESATSGLSARPAWRGPRRQIHRPALGQLQNRADAVDRLIRVIVTACRRAR